MSGNNRTPLLMSVQAGMAAGSTVAVALRFYTRIIITRNVRWDDWFMLIALFFSWGVSGPGLASAHYGMGRHMADLPPSDIPKALMWVWVARLSTILAFAFAKLSIACLLLRIASIKKKYRYILYGSMVVNIAVSIVWFIMTVKCVPASANWNGEGPGDKCIPTRVTVAHAYWAGAAHSALDLMFAILPIALVWDLQLSSRTKAGIAVLLSMGLFAFACSVKKNTETARLGAVTDITWEFTDLSIWNMVELNVGIICGSIPCIRPLVQRWYHGGKSMVTSSGGKGTGVGRSGYGAGYGKMGTGAGRSAGGIGGVYGDGSRIGGGGGGRAKRGSLVPDLGGGGHNQDHESYMMRSGLKHAGKGGLVTSKIRSAGAGGDGDDDSEENILPMHGGIVQTTEVEIRYAGSVVGDDDGHNRREERAREGSGSGLSASERVTPRQWGGGEVR